MAGEAIIINPRRRRRRKATARRRTTTTRRRRRRAVHRNPIMFNARRRRRRVTRSRRVVRRRRVHRNPRLPFVGSIPLGSIAAAGVGYVGARYGAAWLLSFMPAAWRSNPQTAPLMRAGAKAVIGFVVLPTVSKLFFRGKGANAMAIGAGVAVIADLFDSYAASMLPLPAGAVLGDYETGIIQGLGMGAYETGTLSGMDGDGAYGGSAY